MLKAKPHLTDLANLLDKDSPYIRNVRQNRDYTLTSKQGLHPCNNIGQCIPREMLFEKLRENLVKGVNRSRKEFEYENV